MIFLDSIGYISWNTKVKLSQNISHKRVWLCEVCEQAPPIVTCKEDVAALCVTYDCATNSRSYLHERSPFVLFFDTAKFVVKSTATTGLLPSNESTNNIFINPNDLDLYISGSARPVAEKDDNF
ncbi:Zinc finger protein CONSTANS-LIKE 5 [Abeliophyllum distichum]|uniref:Zinc finger protein CONSTANS-LIKE 5 n=1 Tax=Abeliophyllum distichum TaxID=126358 RepID=A0ABD1PBS7_9LAMI